MTTGLLGWYSEQAESFQARAALVSNGEPITYARLQESILSESTRLRRSGIGPGTCIVLDRCANSEAWVVGLLAGLAMGASPILVDVDWPVSRKRDLTRTLRPVAALAGTSDLRSEAVPEATNVGESRAADPPGVWLFTSGTTGLPKPHFRSLPQLETMVARIRGRLPAEATAGIPVGLCLVPLHHGYGLMNALLLVHALGGTVVLDERFLPRRAVGRIRLHGVKLLFGTPAHFRILARPALWRGCSGTELVWCVNSSGKLDSKVARRFADLSGCPVREQYGTTETGPLCVDADLPPAGLEGCVGRPLDGVRFDVRDASGGSLPLGRSGHLAVRFADGSVPKLRAAGDGFFFTGDIGALDADGRVFVQRRADASSAVGARRVPSDLIAEVLRSHPAVTSVRIESSPNASASERARVFVSTRDPIDQGELRSHCRRYLTTAEMRFDLKCQTPSL
jgi:acyl-coenzyme A synthetase/AMP-(fatty) acid ligase